MTGFVELRASAWSGVDGTPVLAVQRFRPTFTGALSDRVGLTTTVEATLSEGRRLQQELERTVAGSELQPFFDLAGCIWPERPDGPFAVEDAGDVVFVDRLHLDANLPAADLRIGRQSVQWGSAQVINPTDPFPQVLFAEPWRPRVGLNAARITLPWKAHQAQLLVGTDDRLRHLRAAARATVNAVGTDLSVVGAWRGDDGSALVGLDAKGTLGVGWWFEGALHVRPEATATRPDRPREELIAGVDYSLPVLDGVLVAAQYYRNGRGDPDAGGLAGSALAEGLDPPLCEGMPTEGLFPDPDEDPFRPFARGRDYALLTALIRVTPDVELTAGALQNLGDGTGVAVPTVRVLPVGWLAIAASAQVPYRAWGDGGEFAPSPEDQQLAVDVLGTELTADLSGLVPAAAFHLWTRASF